MSCVAVNAFRAAHEYDELMGITGLDVGIALLAG